MDHNKIFNYFLCRLFAGFETLSGSPKIFVRHNEIEVVQLSFRGKHVFLNEITQRPGPKLT